MFSMLVPPPGLAAPLDQRHAPEAALPGAAERYAYAPGPCQAAPPGWAAGPTPPAPPGWAAGLRAPPPGQWSRPAPPTPPQPIWSRPTQFRSKAAQCDSGASTSSDAARSSSPSASAPSPRRPPSPRSGGPAEVGGAAAAALREGASGKDEVDGVKKLEKLVWLQLQCSKDADLAGVPLEAMSYGSVGHPHACTMPCKFFATKRGCKDGLACSHCHACHWRSCLRRTRVRKEKRA